MIDHKATKRKSLGRNRAARTLDDSMSDECRLPAIVLMKGLRSD